MGSGAWSTDSYTARKLAKKAAGMATFDYSDRIRRRPRAAWKVHEALDPKSANKKGRNAGRNVREALDNPDKGQSLPIAVLFDVTGSMKHVPAVLQRRLPDLHELLKSGGAIEDPQILFGAVGDAYCDQLPLQVGQFEADNRMDEQLESIVLEGGGGGGAHESYELAIYFMARHSDLDSVKERGKKGYLFLIGDEMPYQRVSASQVHEMIGDELSEDLHTEDVVRELQELFEVYFLFVAEGSYSEQEIMPAWRELLGERALVLASAEDVSSEVAGIVARSEAAREAAVA